VVTIDLKKTYRVHYTAKRTPTVVDVPMRSFVMIDGQGDPNTSQQYQEAVEALYPIAYAFRAAIKATTGDAYTVMPLEGLWWVEHMADFDPADKSNWSWTAMICLPDAVTDIMAAEVIPDVTARKDLAAGAKARVVRFTEGLAAQILHIGPYADEAPTIDTLHEFIDGNGHSRVGKHHEIYLSDPRRADPAKMRTIIRQPFTP
jgi:hypothetical protein